MHHHRIDSFLIADNVRIEIVHETNPYFAGERISLVVRVRHLGSMEQYLNFKDKIDNIHKDTEEQLVINDNVDPENDNGNSKPWIMNSLFNALKRGTTSAKETAKLETDKQYRSYVAKQIQYHKPVDLMAGFIQIMGLFQYDSDFINDKTFESVSHNIIGLNGPSQVTNKKSDLKLEEDSSDDLIDKDKVQKYIQSRFKLTPGDTNVTLDSTTHPLANFQDFVEEFEHIPTLIIPQTLLFPEVTLEPGEVKSFHFKSEALPSNLSPSYTMSEKFGVNYFVEFGVSKVLLNSITPISVKIPICIAPSVTSKGYQYISELGTKPHIMKVAHIKAVNQTSVSKRKSSTSSVVTFGRRRSSISLMQENNSDNVEKLKRSFVNFIKKTNNFEDMEEVIDSQLNVQFPDSGNTSDINQTDFESLNDIENLNTSTEKGTSSTRLNIANLKRFPIEVSSSQETSFYSEKHLVPQLANIQKKYIINRNGEKIADIALSKPFYTASDDISLVIRINENDPQLNVSAVSVELNLLEIINPKYLYDNAVDERKKPRNKHIAEAHAVCFDKSSSIPLKLVIPKTPMNQLPSQFKCNIFELKWVLSIKFILIPQNETSNIFEFYKDKKGVLFHSSETIEGEEFNCRIPVTMLPTSENFGGW